MKIKLLLINFLIIILVGNSGCIGRGRNISGLKILINLSKNDKLKQQQVKRETEYFKKVKYYITNEKVISGISAKIAVKQFGHPILVLPDSEGEKWVYKSSDADWIGGEKAYLFFDKKSNLLKWECIDCR